MKKKFFQFLCVMMLILAFTSCVTARKVNYMQKPGIFIPSYPDSLSFEEYKVKVDDRLMITVYSLDDQMNTYFNGGMSANNISMSQGGIQSELYTYLVDDKGYIDIPLIGKVNIIGKSLRDTRDILEDELKSYFKLDQLSIDIRIVGRYYSIIGQSASGRFSLSRDKINIFQALAQAGDIGMYGDKSKIRILRETENGPQIRTFDVRSEDIINSEFYYIEPNDIIYIQNRTDQVFGITHFFGIFGVVSTAVSLGYLIYDIAKCK